MKYLLIFICAILSAQKAVIIGDSQVDWIAKNSKLATKDSELSKVGVGLSGLNKMILRKKVNPQARHVFISIGTNDNYQYRELLFYQNLRDVFPYAQFYLIGGSWGWGNVKKYNHSYYKNFRGMKLLRHSIGRGDPHRNKSEYRLIGQEIDSIVALD